VVTLTEFSEAQIDLPAIDIKILIIKNNKSIIYPQVLT
jgi:hypothetical protein